MQMSHEFLFTVIVQFTTMGAFLGSLAMAVKFLEEQIKRLETKQDRHNNLFERLIKVEESSKSAHHRIDTLEK